MLLCQISYIFGKFVIFVCFRHCIIEFFLIMCLMLINHSNPYIHNTTVLCENKQSLNTAIKIARYYVMATDLTE